MSIKLDKQILIPFVAYSRTINELSLYMPIFLPNGEQKGSWWSMVDDNRHSLRLNAIHPLYRCIHII
jgi:hypothetical protein